MKRLLAFATLVLACAGPVSATAPTPEALFKRLSALADSGNAEIQYNLGMFLNNGLGTARDSKAAFRHFSEAAQAGNPLAAYKVGCYYAGQFAGTVPADEAAALKFKLVAAEAGYDLAQQDVGVQFRQKGDIASALAWWEKASHQGNTPATAYLADHFSRPDSPEKAKGLALMLILKEQMPNPTMALLDRLAAAQAGLSEEQRAEAARIRASWVSGPTPLTIAARAGISAVPALLRATEK